MQHYIFFVGLGYVDSRHQRAGFVSTLEKRMIERFGGFSHSVVSGGWRAPDGTIHREASLRVELVTDVPRVEEWINDYVKVLFDQQSVLVLKSGSTATFV